MNILATCLYEGGMSRPSAKRERVFQLPASANEKRHTFKKMLIMAVNVEHGYSPPKQVNKKLSSATMTATPKDIKANSKCFASNLK